MITFTKFTAPLGPLLLINSELGLHRILFPDDTNPKDHLAKLFPNRITRETTSGFSTVREQLTLYFAGALKYFNLNLDLKTTPYFKRVLDKVDSIPYGNTASYAEIAAQTGNPRAVRAVGAANARNPIPIIIPCHRVIASNGKLHGYAGGLERKKYLLKLEGFL
ncbi:MAG: methylated-DNA--[protein]-cysteine S-methyltransferase [Candidatus Neomarinimicrobiota bacterium]